MIIISPKPNTECRNEECRRLFYSCKSCVKTANWKAFCCSLECYNKWQEQVAKSRQNNKSVSLLPKRIDITSEEVKNIIDTPIEKVNEDTINEFKELGYLDTYEEVGLTKTVEQINEDINKLSLKSKRKNKRADGN